MFVTVHGVNRALFENLWLSLHHLSFQYISLDHKNCISQPNFSTHKIHRFFNKLWNHSSIVLSFLDFRFFRPSSNFCFYTAFSKYTIKGTFSINSFLVLFTMKMKPGWSSWARASLFQNSSLVSDTPPIFYIASHSYYYWSSPKNGVVPISNTTQIFN